jgi:hypothetical protein
VTIARRNSLSILLAFLISPIPSSATTIILLITTNGIVMSTDSKKVGSFVHDGVFSQTGESTTRKFTVVQDRILVASDGHLDIKTGSIHYNFLAWMENLKAGLRKDISVDDLTSTIETESARMFRDFDIAPLKHKASTETCVPFTEYIIAGYQNGAPRAYVIKFHLDWSENKLINPPPILLDSGDQRYGPGVGNVRSYSFGVYGAVTDVGNKRSYSYKQAMIHAPKALAAIIEHREISIDEAITLTRTLVQIEESTNPNEVGGSIHTVKVLPNGRAYDPADEPPNPNGQRKRLNSKATQCLRQPRIPSALTTPRPHRQTDSSHNYGLRRAPTGNPRG